MSLQGEFDESVSSGFWNELNATHVTDYNNETLPVREPGPYDHITKEIWHTVRMLNVVCRPILIVFGTIGNFLAFYIMRRGSLKNVSTCFYMSVLALADTGFLWSGAFAIWLKDVTKAQIDLIVLADCKIFMFLMPFTSHYSSALLVIMSIEKFFALYFPLRTKSICTVRTAKRVCFLALLFFVILNLQTFFIFSKRKEHHYYYCAVVRVPPSYEKVFFRLNYVFYSFVPFGIMFLANFAIIYKFMAAKWKSNHSGTESTNQALSKSAVKGTAMLITVSLAFIILTGPVAVLLATSPTPHPLIETPFAIIRYLNHSINAVLYCVSGSRFRRELLETITCCRKKSGRPLSRVPTISSTMLTNVSQSVSSFN